LLRFYNLRSAGRILTGFEQIVLHVNVCSTYFSVTLFLWIFRWEAHASVEINMVAMGQRIALPHVAATPMRHVVLGWPTVSIQVRLVVLYLHIMGPVMSYCRLNW